MFNMPIEINYLFLPIQTMALPVMMFFISERHA